MAEQDEVAYQSGHRSGVRCTGLLTLALTPTQALTVGITLRAALVAPAAAELLLSQQYAARQGALVLEGYCLVAPATTVPCEAGPLLSVTRGRPYPRPRSIAQWCTLRVRSGQVRLG